MGMNPGRHTFVATGESLRPLEITRELPSGDAGEVLLAPERPHVETRIRVAASVAHADIFFDRFLVSSGRYEARIQPEIGRAPA